MQLTKVLIANRGEIALRVIRACRDLGIQTVAVYSDADRHELHRGHADEAHRLGPAPAAQSYLRAERIIDIARSTGCQAIHPGYGFLAENAEFAGAVERAGMTFIGPTAQTIRQMGDKLAARGMARELGIPSIPGMDRAVADPSDASEEAKRIGFPVMIKAAAGGGGKGMRIVQTQRELKEFLPRARSEAQAAFGDPSLYLEKFIPHAKHIEVQVLSDHYGLMVHLGERECSIQRRHQKLIEEAPAPQLTPAERATICQWALTIARAAQYRSAGTVEFLYDVDARKFYFLEMNTRIQVEHPVTEMVTGVDIVREQLRIAAGEKLNLRQDDLCTKGHAISCRIYAEDPRDDFLPSTGVIEELSLPTGPGVRLDHSLYPGQRVTPFYDPLLGKLILWAEDRAGAIANAMRALGEFFIVGVNTTIGFHRSVLAHPLFAQGVYQTDFIATQAPVAPPGADLIELLATAAAVRWTQEQQAARGKP